MLFKAFDLRKGLKGTSLLLCFVLALGTALAVPASDAEAKSSYGQFMKNTAAGPPVPGHTSDWVPQGLAVAPDKDWTIFSHYWDNQSRPSIITVNSISGHKRLKTLNLYEKKDGKIIPHKGHVGGLAITDKHLWIASGKKVYQIPLSTIAAKKDRDDVVMSWVQLDHKASYATYADGILWIGQYTDGKDANKSGCAGGPKGRLRGYTLTRDGQFPASRKPDHNWVTPDRIQGVTFTKDRVIYSQSCGRNNASKLLVHKRGSNSKLITSYTIPPMSENIQMVGSNLHILFESGAKKYRDGAFKIYNVRLLNKRYLGL